LHFKQIPLNNKIDYQKIILPLAPPARICLLLAIQNISSNAIDNNFSK
jgi:hypothetical protein